MNKRGLLNAEIMATIVATGHTDMLTICDAGLPIPHQCKKIDLAVTPGCPGFMQVLKPVLDELQVEKVIIAEELKAKNPQIYQELLGLLKGIPVVEVKHEEFKELSRRSVAFIRTGECTPYANIILVGGVTF